MTNQNDEEQKKEAERKATEERAAKEAKEAEENNGNGVPGKENSSTLIDAANKANAEKKELLNREEALQLRKEKFESDRLLGGRASAGAEAQPPKKMTDIEYAEALERGEVNPMKEDGFK